MMFTNSAPEALVHDEIDRLQDLRERFREYGSPDGDPIMRRIQCHLDIAIASLERDSDALAMQREQHPHAIRIRRLSALAS